MNISNLSFLMYLFVTFLFLGIVSIPLFSEGMFMDGLLYSAISNNMANGIGSFWKPHLSNTIFPEFYEHPPLALGLQALWFKLFGDSIFVERFYSLFTYFLTGIGISFLWKQLGKSLKTAWIPLLFWLLVSNVIWAAPNNMLENTMTVFVVFSTWSYLKGINKDSLIFVITSGILLSLALLSKGFVCLYIWAFPIGLFLFKKNISFSKVFIHTIILILSTILPIVALYYFSEDAAFNISSYFKKQVVGSIKNVTIVNSRFAIIGEFFQHIILPLSIGLIILLIDRIKNKKNPLTPNKKNISLLGFILLCGILPIMISMKQRGFYILTVYPFFGLLMGLLILPILEPKLNIWEKSEKLLRSLSITVFLLFITSIILSVMQIGKSGRDKDEISDCKKVIEYIGENKTIDICLSQQSNWDKHGYYSRYGKISLDREKENLQSYFLVNIGECEPNLEQYNKVNLELIKHNLYQRK